MKIAYETATRTELVSLPEGLNWSVARRRIDTIADHWSLLRNHGRRAFAESGWRELGLGAVHVADPAFDALAGSQTAAWAVLDRTDGWRQTVATIVERTRHYEPATAEALRRARADLYQVAVSTGPQLRLRRVRDGEVVTIHALADESAVPSGALVVARVAAVAGVRVLLHATVVGRSAAATRLAAVDAVPGGALIQLSLDGARRAIDAARGAVEDPEWLRHGPRTTRRVHRAVEALEEVMRRRGAQRLRTDSGPAVIGVERGPDAFAVTVDLAPLRRIRLHRIRREPGPIMTELATQAGLERHLLRGDPASQDEWEELAARCSSAAAKLRGVNVSRAA